MACVEVELNYRPARLKSFTVCFGQMTAHQRTKDKYGMKFFHWEGDSQVYTLSFFKLANSIVSC